MILNKIKTINKKLFRNRSEEGAALIFFISIILAMSILTGYLLDLNTTSTFGELSYNHLERAYFMAEAGGNYANNLVKLDIETDATYDDDYLLHNQTFTLDNDGGTQEGQFKIVIDDTDTNYTLIHSTGTVNSGIYSDVEVKLTYSMAKTSSSAVFDQTVFAGNNITLDKDVTIEGDLGTNASSISQASGVTITGDEQVNAGKTLTPISFSCGTCTDDKDINSSETWNGTYEYLNVTIDAGKTLSISGDVILYVKEDFFAGIGSKIKILSDSSLTIYVDGNAEFKKDFAVEFDPQPDRAKDFVIYGTSNANTIKLAKDITFIGAIYAPSADITIQKAQSFIGAVVGDTISVDKDGTITYDASVQDISTPVVGNIVLSQPEQYFSS